jgi:hypothetical protein
MTPEILGRLEKLWMWLTLIAAGTIKADAPPAESAGRAAAALREMLDELKGKPPGPTPTVAVATVASPDAWPATNTAIKALCDIWVARWGPGSAPGDVIRNAALTLKKDGAPWRDVVRSFQRYVDIVDNTYASPYAWRKKWRSYDPETPEHDHEGAAIADSMDRQLRQRSRAPRGQGGGMQRVGETLKGLPEGLK